MARRDFPGGTGAGSSTGVLERYRFSSEPPDSEDEESLGEMEAGTPELSGVPLTAILGRGDATRRGVEGKPVVVLGFRPESNGLDRNCELSSRGGT